jgi:hypothetical protein
MPPKINILREDQDEEPSDGQSIEKEEWVKTRHRHIDPNGELGTIWKSVEQLQKRCDAQVRIIEAHQQNINLLQKQINALTEIATRQQSEINHLREAGGIAPQRSLDDQTYQDDQVRENIERTAQDRHRENVRRFIEQVSEERLDDEI